MSRKAKDFFSEEWKDALKKWDMADFKVPVYNSKGYSSVVNYRTSPEQVQNENMIISSRRFPFRDASELRRWCMHWGTKILMELEPEYFEKANMLAESDRRVIERRQDQEADVQRINNLIETVNTALATGQKQQARKLVKQAQETYRKVFGKDEERRNWLLKQLEEKFSDLSKPAKIIPLREIIREQQEQNGTDGQGGGR
jgi:hypothetical protein